MSKKVSFTPIDFSKHPETIQLDGQNLFALRYDSKHSRLYVAYDSINRSLDYCLRNADYIDHFRSKTDERFVNESLFAHSTSIIVNYGRCFASGRAKLERKNVPKKHLDTHDKLIKLRNEYIAHSGGAGESSVNLIALYPNRDEKRIVNICPPYLGRFNFINTELMDDLRDVVEYLKSFVDEKLKLHYEKICEQIREIDINNLYAEFDKFELEGLEYSPQFTLGEYQFKLDIKPNGLIYLKGLKK